MCLYLSKLSREWECRKHIVKILALCINLLLILRILKIHMFISYTGTKHTKWQLNIVAGKAPDVILTYITTWTRNIRFITAQIIIVTVRISIFTTKGQLPLPYRVSENNFTSTHLVFYLVKSSNLAVILFLTLLGSIVGGIIIWLIVIRIYINTKFASSTCII